jgi:hypothetical protein
MGVKFIAFNISGALTDSEPECLLVKTSITEAITPILLFAFGLFCT